VSWQYGKRELKHILLVSVVINFIVKTIFDILIGQCLVSNIQLYTCLLFLVAITSAYLIALLSRSKLWENICKWLEVNRTQNTYIWNDIFKRDAWIRIYLKDGVTTYLGQILMCEENCREPIVVLARYQLVNRKGDIIIDNSNCDKEFIILNLKDFERAELIDI